MHNAYTNQDYEEVELQASRAKIASYQARDMLIQSSLERIIVLACLENNSSHINPLSEAWQFEVERVLTSKELMYKSPWSKFHNFYIEEIAKHYISSTSITATPLIFKKLQKYSDEVSFRGKEIYQANCYLYPLLQNIKYLNENITLYHQSLDKKRNILMKQMNKDYLDKMKISMKRLKDEKEIKLNQVFYYEYEKVLCDSIETILNFRKYNKDKTKQEYFSKISLEIYECLQLSERENTKYIRSSEEQAKISKIYNKILNTTNQSK